MIGWMTELTGLQTAVDRENAERARVAADLKHKADQAEARRLRTASYAKIPRQEHFSNITKAIKDAGRPLCVKDLSVGLYLNRDNRVRQILYEMIEEGLIKATGEPTRIRSSLTRRYYIPGMPVGEQISDFDRKKLEIKTAMRSNPTKWWTTKELKNTTGLVTLFAAMRSMIESGEIIARTAGVYGSVVAYAYKLPENSGAK